MTAVPLTIFSALLLAANLTSPGVADAQTMAQTHRDILPIIQRETLPTFGGGDMRMMDDTPIQLG